MNLETLYKSYATDKDCKELLLQSHWFASFADFDPKTGESLPMLLSDALRRMANREPCPFVKDRLWLLMQHSVESARRLMKSLSEEPRREPAYLPIRDVRELDTASFIALSRRPGRNIREKLADKPYMQAVRHFQSIDVPENRLLKTYLVQLADALELRKQHLKDKSVDDMLQAIYRWLNEEEIQEISRWENLAPNNALLSHRDYRRVWNSWRLLQTIEEDLDRDMAHLEERGQTRAKWEALTKRYSSGNTVFADMPLLVDYNHFEVIPWDQSLPTLQASGVTHSREFFETHEPACIDLTQLKPVFATPSTYGELGDAFFWQRWYKDGEEVDLELFDTDAVYVHADSKTVTSSDMFFFRGDVPEVLNQASRAFSLRLRQHFHNGRMIWLTPDNLNDFELELVRRNINAGFSKAEPLPCSVAAVFEHIDYSKITRDGYRVAVVERINGKAYLTEMVARFDKELSEALPITRGYVWEKGTTEVIGQNVEIDSVDSGIYLLSRDGSWTKDCNPYGVSHKTTEDVVMKYEGYDLAIWLNSRPVRGGIRLYQLQSQVADIPLWRNHIPELMTKVMMNGFYQPFYFVGKDVTVQPVRGKAIRINVPQEFTLPKGKKAYRLPLLQGSNEEALEYEAKLVSKDFPYSEDVRCRLDMTYTYGADDPYHLVFRPMDSRYKPISVIWQLKEDVVIDDAPAPDYPAPLSWAEMQRHYNPAKDEYRDLTTWATSSCKKLLEILSPLTAQPMSAEIKSDWRTDRNGKRFTFAYNPRGDDFFIHESNLAHGVDPDRIDEGDTVYFFTEEWKGKTQCKYVAPKAEWARDGITYNIAPNASKYIHSALYVPFIRLWADGKSCSDQACPATFRREIVPYSNKIFEYFMMKEASQWLKRDLLFLLCCMGNDMPSAMSRQIPTLVREKKIDERALGFALGGLTEAWQRDAFAFMLEQNNGFSMRVFAHASWRNESFVRAFSYEDLLKLLKSLEEKIEKNSKKISGERDQKKRSQDVAHMTRYLELLLALLRTRESDDERIKMLLQPGQDITMHFAEQINELIADAVKRHDAYFSRVQLDVSMKPSDDKTPDLLYALRVYLEGDDAANAIRVTGIAEDDE